MKATPGFSNRKKNIQNAQSLHNTQKTTKQDGCPPFSKLVPSFRETSAGLACGRGERGTRTQAYNGHVQGSTSHEPGSPKRHPANQNPERSSAAHLRGSHSDPFVRNTAKPKSAGEWPKSPFALLEITIKDGLQHKNETDNFMGGRTTSTLCKTMIFSSCGTAGCCQCIVFVKELARSRRASD